MTSPTLTAECIRISTLSRKRRVVGENGRVIPLRSNNIGRPTDVTTGWQGRRDDRRQQRNQPRDRARVCHEGAHVFIAGRRQSELNEAKALIGDGVIVHLAEYSD
jgi:hypothetical protein